MKKAVTFFMVTVMAAFLVACGQSNDSGSETRVEVIEETTAVTEPTTESEVIVDMPTVDVLPEEEDLEDVLVGGWTRAASPVITEEVKKVCDKAFEGWEGVNYEPIALLKTQVVAGMNYCVLCEATVVVPDAEPTYAVVYIYEDLEGNAQITDILNFEEPANE